MCIRDSITDEQIVEACKREARTIDELFMVRGMREKLNTRDARTVAGLMKKAIESLSLIHIFQGAYRAFARPCAFEHAHVPAVRATRACQG